MMILSSLLGLLSLLCTLTGISLFLKNKLQILPCFLPIFTITSTTLVVFLGGLINILDFTILGLTCFGAGYLLVGLKKIKEENLPLFHKSQVISALTEPSTLFFLLSSLYFIILLHGFTLYFYDDFTHWGTVWKEMVNFRSLPDSRTVVTYHNYPPITALWCYFICYFLGNGESTALIAQSFLMTASLTTLFCHTKKNDSIKILTLILAIMINFFCVLSEQRFSLNVDGILGYLTVAIFVIIYFYREDVSSAMKFSAPLFLFLLLVKDSGKFFLAMGLLLLLSSIINEIKRNYLEDSSISRLKNPKNMKISRNFFALISIVVFTNYLWSRYVDKAYAVASYEANKFEASSISVGIAGKTPRFMASLPTLFTNSLLDFRYYHTYLFFAIIALSLFCLLLFAVKKVKAKNLLGSTFFLLGMSTLYLLGLYGMYATVMPIEEHPENYLVAFDRYFSTMILIFFLVQIFMILEELPSFEKLGGIYTTAQSLLVVVSLILIPFLGHNIFAHPSFDHRLRDESLITLFQEASEVVPRNQRVLISMKEYNTGTSVYYHISRYELGSDYESSVIDDNDFALPKEELVEKLSQYQYILIHDNMDTAKNTFTHFDIPFYYDESVSVYGTVMDEGVLFLYPCYPEP